MTRSSFRATVAPVALVASVALAACEHQKSSNPLSPTIAGPLPGVEITQPKLLEPGQGVKFKDKQQPITLLVENASSTGVRPVLYGFQIAADAGFTNIVFTRQDVPQGENGRTALKLQDKLQLGRTYYWRAWAYDGANTGPMTSSVSFDVYPPVTISPPTLAGPASGSTLTTVVPFLSVRNSARTGPAGNVSYAFQVSATSSFSQIVASNPNQPENVEGQTSWVPGGLNHSATYFWRARASDGETSSDWSATWSFSTPAPAPAPAPSPGGPAPGGSCASRAGDPEAVVECRRAQYGATISPSQAPGLLRAIAQDLNAGTSSSFYGVLQKTSGNNCSGIACDIVCARNGSGHWDVLIDGPDATVGYAGAAAPSWQPKGTISPSACIAP
jgi:hypothetical protein